MACVSRLRGIHVCSIWIENSASILPSSVAVSWLQWRHNERYGVSNHQSLECLFNRLFRRRSKKHQSSASLAFVRGIHRLPVNSPHKWPVTRKMFPFDDVIMLLLIGWGQVSTLCLRQQLSAIARCDVMTWKRFPHHWPFVGGIHQSPVGFPQRMAMNMKVWCLSFLSLV